MIIAIAAISKQTRAIGKDNGLIWKLPNDLARFRALSKGHPVIMGRKTWESLPAERRPLPGRTNIVVTRDRDYDAPGAIVVTSMEEAIADAQKASGNDVIVVMGGGEIYSLALPLTDRLELTEVDDPVEGHAHFPEIPGFTETKREPHEENGIKYDFVTYDRASNA